MLDKFEGLLSDMQWNWTGTQLVTTSKEKACRVWDVRANTVAQVREELHMRHAPTYSSSYTSAMP